LARKKQEEKRSSMAHKGKKKGTHRLESSAEPTPPGIERRRLGHEQRKKKRKRLGKKKLKNKEKEKKKGKASARKDADHEKTDRLRTSPEESISWGKKEKNVIRRSNYLV